MQPPIEVYQPPIQLYERQTFASFNEAVCTIHDFVIKKKIRFFVLHNDKDLRYCLHCKNDDRCIFKINCYQNRKKVHITSLQLGHTCDQFATLHVSSNSAFIARKVTTYISDNPKLPVSQMQLNCRRVHGIDAPYWAAWNAKKQALTHFYGDMDGSFSYIGSYIQRLNDNGDMGILETMEDEGSTRFHRCFISFRTQQIAMLHCKPIIMLDACHIKNSYSGVVVAASTVDGEGTIVNVAFGICPIENREHWVWFLAQLKRAIPALQQMRIAAISDRAKGLIHAVHHHFPHWEHCFCAHHIQENILKNNPLPKDLKKAFWKAAKTLNEADFIASMNHIEQEHPRVFEYLSSIDRTTWTTCYANVAKFKQTTSNVAESFNSWIGEERLCPHLNIIVEISRKLMQHFYDKRLEYPQSDNTQVKYGPLIEALLNKNMEDGGKCLTTASTTAVYLVKGPAPGREEYRVNLREKTCSCLYFQQRKFPCMHACEAIRQCRERCIHDFVHDSYKLASLRLAYEHPIEPVLFGELVKDHVKPPIVKKQPGRPRKLRIRSRGERGPGRRCSNCGLVCHHNARTCEARQRAAAERAATEPLVQQVVPFQGAVAGDMVPL